MFNDTQLHNAKLQRLQAYEKFQQSYENKYTKYIVKYFKNEWLEEEFDNISQATKFSKKVKGILRRG